MRKRFALLMSLLCLALPVLAVAQTTQPTTQPSYVVPVFNASGKSLPGSQPVNFIYDQNLFAGDADRTKSPDPAYVLSQIRNLPAHTLTIIDHEAGNLTLAQWNTQITSAQVRSGIAQYVEIIKLVRKLRPDLKPLTFFGATVSDDYDYVQCENTDVRRMLSDIPNTLSLKPIADQCDVICVPVYDAQASGWREHAYRQLMLGRIWGKKVYAVLCPAPNGNILPAATMASDAKWTATFSDALVMWDWDPAGTHTTWIGPLAQSLSR